MDSQNWERIGSAAIESRFSHEGTRLIYPACASVVLSPVKKDITEWSNITQDVSLVAAIADRLLHHGGVFYLKGERQHLSDQALAIRVFPRSSRLHRRP